VPARTSFPDAFRRDSPRTSRHSATARHQLCALEGYLGSASATKWRERDGCFDQDVAGAPIPAVLIFLEKKAGVAADALVPATLDADGVSCATDVVVGRMA